MGVSAKIVAHSQLPNQEEIITMEIECHRFILPEINTHRVFSRNFQSSRAIPVKRMIEMIRENPAYPVHWGKNQSGMQAYEEHDDAVMIRNNDGFDWDSYSAKEAWDVALNEACHIAECFERAGYHKQIVNRLIEPFMWQKGVVTATRKGFEGFFKLRSHSAAQPEIKALSDAMVEALEASTPTQLAWGEWHLPYVEEDLPLEQAIKVSTSCCAQVSYRRLDDSLEKAEKIFDMLHLNNFNVETEDLPHASPCEHQVRASLKQNSKALSGNFASHHMTQYRKLLEKGLKVK